MVHESPKSSEDLTQVLRKLRGPLLKPISLCSHPKWPTPHADDRLAWEVVASDVANMREVLLELRLGDSTERHLGMPVITTKEVPWGCPLMPSQGTLVGDGLLLKFGSTPSHT